MRRIIIMLFPLWITALACTETNPVEPGRSEGAEAPYTVRVLPPRNEAPDGTEATRKAPARPTGVLPTFNINGTNDPEEGTGSATVSQSGAGKKSSPATGTPSALSWTATNLYVTYDGSTQPYLFNATEAGILADMQDELGLVAGFNRPGGACAACLFTREWASADEAARHLQSQGLTARALDQDRLEVEMPLRRGDERRFAARLTLDLRERVLESATLLIDGREAFQQSWSDRAQAAPATADLFTLEGTLR